MELKFKTLNSGWLEDSRQFFCFQTRKPVNRRDKKALRALLPKGPERTTLVLDSLSLKDRYLINGPQRVIETCYRLSMEMSVKGPNIRCSVS